MPTTIKGIPYPADTAAPNVPNDMQALAENLDFSKVTVLTAAQIPSSGTPMETYPLGISVLSVGSGEAANWPNQATGQLWTYKANTARCAQLYMTNFAGPALSSARVYYRQMQPSGGPHTPWVALAPWSTIVTMPDVAAATAQTAAVTFPVNMFATATAVAAAQGNSSLFAGLVTGPTPTGVTVYCRNTGATTVTAPKVHVIVEGGN